MLGELILELSQFGFFLVELHLFRDFARLIVENNQVPAHQVEAAQMLARILGVKNVFVHHKRRSLGV